MARVCCPTGPGLPSFCHSAPLRRHCHPGSEWIRRVAARATRDGQTARTTANTGDTGTDGLQCACGSDASVHRTERTSIHSPTTGKRTASRLHIHNVHTSLAVSATALLYKTLLIMAAKGKAIIFYRCNLSFLFYFVSIDERPATGSQPKLGP